MSDKEKEKYKELANKTSATSSAPKKYTTQGVPIDFVKNAENEKRAYELKMFENISRTVRNMVASNEIKLTILFV